MTTDRAAAIREIVKAWAQDVRANVSDEQIDSLATELTALEPDWIPVAERLPSEGDAILIYDDMYIVSGWFRAGLIFNETCFEAEPTHWRPLPAPPTNEAKNKL